MRGQPQLLVLKLLRALRKAQKDLHCANLVLVPVISIVSLVLVPVIQFFSCALLDHGVLNVMLVMLSQIEFEA